MAVKTYSTIEVANLAGIEKSTLYRWVRSGAIPEPKRGYLAGRDFRIWTAKDVERVKRHKEKFYRKGRGRKKKTKA